MISRENPGPVVVPIDFEARLVPIMTAPFVAKGNDPTGWDCRGCAHWIWRTILGVEVETYLDAYQAADVMTLGGRARRSAILADRLSAWRPVEAQAGVVAHLRWLGRAGHVAVMLGRTRFVHADLRGGTTIGDLSSPACPYTAVGFYVPAFVTDIIQGARP